MALRIGPEIVSQASTTLRKSASIDDRSSKLEPPECSAHAARHFGQMAEVAAVSAVA
jgi:hypothetical protein